MTHPILILLCILAAALFFFARGRVQPDVVALGVLLALVFTGLLPAKEAFLGFGSDTVIMILGLLILTAALQRTGVVEIAGRLVLRGAGEKPGRLLLIVMLAAASLSTFISNTAAAAFFLPVVFGIARSASISASKLLMPLAFAAILSSSITLVSTSTNLVVSGVMTGYGMAPMGMFELAPVGIPIAVAGILYMLTIGRRMVPDRAGEDSLVKEFGVGAYLSEVRILPGSKLAGKSLAESAFGQRLGLTVVRILREENRQIMPRAGTVLEEGDTLIVEGQRDDLIKIKDVAGIEIEADVTFPAAQLQTEEISLAEAIVLPASPLIGRTLKGYRFHDRHGLQVLAVNHRGYNVVQRLNDVTLQMGDVILVQGRRENIARMHEGGDLRVLGAAEMLEDKRPNFRKAPLAIAIFVGALGLATAGVASLPVAVMLGVFLAFATKCISPEQAYAEVEWKALILIGSMLSLGSAMEHTGAAQYFAKLIVNVAGDHGGIWLLAGFFILTVLLTQPMSNQAAAIVLLPVAIQTANQAGLNPRTFAMMIAVAASCSYLTPLEPACLMVYGPGRYRFIDFLKVGSLLTLIVFAIAMLIVPYFWPLRN